MVLVRFTLELTWKKNSTNVGRPPLFQLRNVIKLALTTEKGELRFGPTGKAYRYINGYKGNYIIQSENTFSYAAAIGLVILSHLVVLLEDQLGTGIQLMTEQMMG